MKKHKIFAWVFEQSWSYFSWLSIFHVLQTHIRKRNNGHPVVWAGAWKRDCILVSNWSQKAVQSNDAESSQQWWKVCERYSKLYVCRRSVSWNLQLRPATKKIFQNSFHQKRWSSFRAKVLIGYDFENACGNRTKKIKKLKIISFPNRKSCRWSGIPYITSEEDLFNLSNAMICNEFSPG